MQITVTSDDYRLTRDCAVKQPVLRNVLYILVYFKIDSNKKQLCRNCLTAIEDLLANHNATQLINIQFRCLPFVYN